MKVQEIIVAVKGIQHSLTGISRSNTALYHAITKQCMDLEKRLISCCDSLEEDSTSEQSIQAEVTQKEEEGAEKTTGTDTTEPKESTAKPTGSNSASLGKRGKLGS